MGHEDTFADVLAHIYFPTSKNDFLAPLRSIAPSLPLSFQETTSAFENNIVGALSVAQLPYVMASDSVYQRRFQAIHTAQRIRSIDKGASEEEREAWALQTALEKFASEQKEDNDKGALGQLYRQVLSDLNGLLTTDFKESADELLRQSTVLCW